MQPLTLTRPPPRHVARKRFGQHFLHDPRVIARIIDAIAPKPHETLVEIGPGLGALTIPLLNLGVRIIAIDIDRDVLAHLTSLAVPPERLELIEADALAYDFAGLSQRLGQPLRVIGNLPYNISTPLLFHLLDQAHHLSDMHFMLQKEVIDRMVAAPNRKTYGRLSVMVQAKAAAMSLFDVGPGAFKPPPKVTSSIVRLQPLGTPLVSAVAQGLFAKVVASAFGQRRKTLRNALSLWLTDGDFCQLNLDPSCRAETLTPAQFAHIAQYLYTRPGSAHAAPAAE